MLWPEAEAWRNRLREEGRALVFTNGCFDILHLGHVDYLERAAALGQAMLVAQSQMTAVGSAQSTSLGETSGITSGIRWRLSVQPFRANEPSGARLEQVSVTAGLARDSRDLVVLKTIRVAR